jgi:hypothetical protein
MTSATTPKPIKAGEEDAVLPANLNKVWAIMRYADLLCFWRWLHLFKKSWRKRVQSWRKPPIVSNLPSRKVRKLSILTTCTHYSTHQPSGTVMDLTAKVKRTKSKLQTLTTKEKKVKFVSETIRLSVQVRLRPPHCLVQTPSMLTTCIARENRNRKSENDKERTASYAP